MANNLWIQNNPHAAAMDSKTFRNSGIRQQGKRLVYWPKEVICLPAVDPYRFWNFVVGKRSTSRHRRYCCWQYRNDPGYSIIGIHADNDTAAAASKIFSLAIPSSSERELHKIMCINHLAKPFFKDFSRENWVEHMFFHKKTLTHNIFQRWWNGLLLLLPLWVFNGFSL